MTGPGGHGWEEDTLVGPGPDTVRMPTSRPPEAPSGVFEIMPPRRGFLEPDGSLWPADPDLPTPGEITGPSTYEGA